MKASFSEKNKAIIPTEITRTIKKGNFIIVNSSEKVRKYSSEIIYPSLANMYVKKLTGLKREPLEMFNNLRYLGKCENSEKVNCICILYYINPLHIISIN